MDYELGRELEQAGFPQMAGTYINLDNIIVGQRAGANDFVVRCPTLTELIEACVGDKPNTFDLEYNEPWTYYEPENPDGRWAIRYYQHTPVGHVYINRCKTPEEAVARLWLALNKD